MRCLGLITLYLSLLGGLLRGDELALNAEAIGKASPEDWKRSAFAWEEQAMKAYDAGEWRNAGVLETQAQLAYTFAFRGAMLDTRCKHWFLKTTGPAREFLDLIKPEDNHEEVYGILDRLYRYNEDYFTSYPRLAMAIALVYDQAPPRRWPHHQVSTKALPRELPRPEAAVEFWIGSERGGKTMHPLGQLTIEELKYVVDVSASFKELRWAQTLKPLKPERMMMHYWSVPYDDERYAENQTTWVGDDYQLSTIREQGGICADQAYYLTQVAKARGVPCFAVTGIMEDGLHAWAGYMEAPGKWNFKAGRTPASPYVTGRFYDPQTWRRPLDHELAFLKERVAREGSFKLSQIHHRFAALAMREGDLKKAINSAREAVRRDNRNLAAWKILLETAEDEEKEGILCWNGAKAFHKYPDLEALFLRRLAELLEQSGEVDRAKQMRQDIIQRNHEARPDLALVEAGLELERIMQEASMKEQIQSYRQYVTGFAQAGLITGYQIVTPFVKHLIREREFELARVAIALARTQLKVRIPEQLERLLERLERRLPIATP